MRGMTDVRRPGNGLRKPSDGQNPAPASKVGEEAEGLLYLVAGGRAVRDRGARMRGHDVPAEDVEVELGERALHDRRARFAGPIARELALGREWNAGHSGAAVARCLTDEDDGRG